MLKALRPGPREAAREQIVIVPHHPDRLRRPSPRVGAIEVDRFHQTLQWNVFRTLELLSPAFWLRRLQARLHMDQVLGAPHIARVFLWRDLSVPLAHLVDGARPDVTADVVIETEHAVWTLMLCDRNQCRREPEPGKADLATQLIDATSWYAGTRACYFGVVSSEPSHKGAGVALVGRYFRSRESLRLRSEARGNSLSNVRGVGALHWTDLAAILRDCEQADVLTDIERALARNALRWLRQVGIRPG